MTKKPPNPLQKLVRGMIRDLIDRANSQKADRPKKPKTKKPAARKSQPKPKQDKSKRSRYIPLAIRVLVQRRDGYKCVFLVVILNAPLKLNYKIITYMIYSPLVS